MKQHLNQLQKKKKKRKEFRVFRCPPLFPSHFSLFCHVPSDEFAIIRLIKQGEHVAAIKNKSSPIAHLHVLY